MRCCGICGFQKLSVGARIRIKINEKITQLHQNLLVCILIWILFQCKTRNWVKLCNIQPRSKITDWNSIQSGANSNEITFVWRALCRELLLTRAGPLFLTCVKFLFSRFFGCTDVSAATSSILSCGVSKLNQYGIKLMWVSLWTNHNYGTTVD